MFRDVPECSGMFRNVPCSGFYRRRFEQEVYIKQQQRRRLRKRLLIKKWIRAASKFNAPIYLV